jgi:proteasome lid subunit RPN8/RPN11
VNEPLHLTEAAMKAMVTHARHEKPREACGFVLGREGLGTMIYPIKNDHYDSLISFRMLASEVTAMYAMLDTQPGLEPIAIYHSHPTRAPEPTDEDIAGHGDLSLAHLIISFRAGGRAAAYRMVLEAIGVTVPVQIPIDVVHPLQDKPSDVPWALIPGNVVRLRYHRRERMVPENELTTTVARVQAVRDGQVMLEPDPSQRAKPTSLEIRRLAHVDVLSEHPDAAVARNDAAGHARLLAGALAAGDTEKAPELVAALAALFPVDIRAQKAAR